VTVKTINTNDTPDINWTPHHVTRRYDNQTKSWVIQLMTKEDYQIGETTYVHSLVEAVTEEKRLKKEHNITLGGKYSLPVNYEELSSKKRREVREQYCVEQKNLCYHCKGNLKEQPPSEVTNKKINWKLFPPNFTKYPIHLQHDHNTGMTEGAVHAYCNAVMWQYEGK